MTEKPSDAVVFFGATGDLAYKQIFPALMGLVRDEGLKVPIIGVAKAGWGLDQLKDRAADSLKHHGVTDDATIKRLTDLLRYVDGAVAPQGSETLRALLSLRPRLDLDEPAILRDLKLEKTLSFEQSTLYQRLYALADAQGEQQPRELIPRIELKSPKITRKLTTEWFARRVEERYRNCLAKTRP